MIVNSSRYKSVLKTVDSHHSSRYYVQMVIDHIRTLIAAGWSQGRIARESGVAQPSIHRMLHGKQVDVLYQQGKRLEWLAANVSSGHIHGMNQGCDQAK